MKKKIVVIPSDPIAAYERKGTSSWLKEYYNPNSYFDEVYVLSPREKKKRVAYGMNIIPVKNGKEFKRLVKSIKPDYIRAYGGFWATDFANFYRVDNIPVVSSIHDTNPKLLHESLRFSDAFFVMSEIIKQVLIKKNLAHEEEIFVIGNRVNTQLFRRIPDIKNPLTKKYENKRIILSIGRKSFEKNLETVIRSLAKLPEQYYLVLIGQGDFSPYEQLAQELGVNHRLENIPKVENNELPYWYNLARVLCVPSRWEGFGLVFAEAAACMTKIVTSNIAPLNEFLINDGIMNTLVDNFEDPKAIANSILQIDNEIYNDDTRELIISKFDIKVVASKEVNAYKNVKYMAKDKTIPYFFWKIRYVSRNKIFSPVLKIAIKVYRKIKIIFGNNG